MFKKLAFLTTILYATTFAHAWERTGPIEIKRDFSIALDLRPKVENFGCIVIRRADGVGGAPYAAVSGSASGSECAQFHMTRDDSGIRFVELSTNKMMSHASGSDWIYFDREVGDTSDDTKFIMEPYTFWKTQETEYTLRPANAGSVIYAQYDAGDLNVKGSGFIIFPEYF